MWQVVALINVCGANANVKSLNGLSPVVCVPCVWLRVSVSVCVCVCVRERERERECTLL
jgi:hypothetical protein